jgi:hypothetical protein
LCERLAHLRSLQRKQRCCWQGLLLLLLLLLLLVLKQKVSLCIQPHALGVSLLHCIRASRGLQQMVTASSTASD